jgi:hypothetical protein
MEPTVIRFNLATTGLTSHAQPLTIRVDLTENTSRTNHRAQGERMGAIRNSQQVHPHIRWR